MPFTSPEALICPIATQIHQEEQTLIQELAAMANEQKQKYNDAADLLNEVKAKLIQLIMLVEEIKGKYNQAVDLLNEVKEKAGAQSPAAVKVEGQAEQPTKSDAQPVVHDDITI